MEQMSTRVAGRPLRLAAGLMAAGVMVMLAGIGLQLAEPRLGLTALLGLGGTVFGLAAKLGGALVLAGLLALGLRQTGAAPPARTDVLEPPAAAAPVPPLRAARAAAALKRAQSRPAV